MAFGGQTRAASMLHVLCGSANGATWVIGLNDG